LGDGRLDAAGAKRRDAAMNNFLERQKGDLGGPKPKGWNTSPSQRRSPSGGAPAALPSGGGLPVFEKRVQLKEPLPHVARGDPSKQKAENPFLQGIPLGEPIMGGNPNRSPTTESPEPAASTPGRKAATPVPGAGTPGKLVRPTIEHRPGASASASWSTPPSAGERSAGAGWSPAQQTGAASPDTGAILAAGGLGSPSLAPIGQGASTRSFNSAPPTSQRTSSPSGRMHPNPVRRAELRKSDMFNNIDYYGGIGAPDNDRLVKEASWLSTQSWFESLRYYPKGEDADDDEAAYSGLTHGMAAPTEHLETDVRTRLGIAKADADCARTATAQPSRPPPARVGKRRQAPLAREPACCVGRSRASCGCWRRAALACAAASAACLSAHACRGACAGVPDQLQMQWLPESPSLLKRLKKSYLNLRR
jgi:hypothetical protein